MCSLGGSSCNYNDPRVHFNLGSKWSMGLQIRLMEKWYSVKCWVIYYLFLTFLTIIFVEFFPLYCDLSVLLYALLLE